MEISNYLQVLGLSDYEIKAFIALQNSTMKARDISNKSKVPYGKIYDALYSLEQKGVIAAIPTVPKLFQAIDIEKALDILLDKKSASLKELKDTKKQIADLLKTKTVEKPKSGRDKLSVFFGQDSWRRLCAELFNTAKKEVFVAAEAGKNKALVLSYLRSLNRGVDSKALIQTYGKHNKQGLLHASKLGAKIRIKSFINGLRLVIKDEEEVLLAVANPKTRTGKINILIKDPGFAKSMRTFYNSAWEKGTDVRKIKKWE